MFTTMKPVELSNAPPNMAGSGIGDGVRDGVGDGIGDGVGASVGSDTAMKRDTMA